MLKLFISIWKYLNLLSALVEIWNVFFYHGDNYHTVRNNCGIALDSLILYLKTM